MFQRGIDATMQWSHISKDPDLFFGACHAFFLSLLPQLSEADWNCQNIPKFSLYWTRATLSILANLPSALEL